jgi:hypothetical protein
VIGFREGGDEGGGFEVGEGADAAGMSMGGAFGKTKHETGGVEGFWVWLRDRRCPSAPGASLAFLGSKTRRL